MTLVLWAYGAGVVAAAFIWGLWMQTLPAHRLKDEVLELLLVGMAVSLSWPLLLVINAGRRAAGPRGA